MKVSPAPMVLLCISQDSRPRNSDYHILNNWCIPRDVCRFLEVRPGTWFKSRCPLIAPGTAKKYPSGDCGEQSHGLEIVRTHSGPRTYALGANVA